MVQVRNPEEKLVSIIVPVYNVQPYLCKCIDSLKNQTYSNIEIILVDDGSNDGSGEICDAQALIDGRIRVIHKKNGGLSEARNYGIDEAKGDYLTFIDSDDFVRLDYISVLLDAAIENEADIVVGQYTEFKGEELIENSPCKNMISSPRKLTANEAINELFGDDSGTYVIACSKLYTRRLFTELRFKLGVIHEDQFISHKLYYIAHTIVVTDQVVYFYRQNEDSITKKSLSKKNIDYLLALEDRFHFFEQAKETELKEKSQKWLLYRCRDYYWLFIEREQLLKKDVVEIYSLILAIYRRGIKGASINYSIAKKELAWLWVFYFSPRLYFWLRRRRGKYANC